MTLLITVLAAVISALVWYSNERARTLRIGTLTLAYWGASIMWFAESVADYLELGEEFFTPSSADMLNDSFLGLSVVILGLVVWVASILIKDPNNIIKNIIIENNN